MKKYLQQMSISNSGIVEQKVDDLIQDFICKGLGEVAFKRSTDDIFEVPVLYVGIDEVAHSLHGRKKPKVTDPVLEILPKNKNGNEVTRFYFTNRGKNVRKSQADVEITYTHTPDGKLLHEERRKINNEDSKDDIN